MKKELIVRTGNARATKYSIQITTTQLLAQMEAMPQMFREILKENYKS